MKKIILLLTIAAFIIAVNLSCKKQQHDSEISKNTIPQMDQAIGPIEQQILRFKDKLQSNLKDEEVYNISEAVYNLEALVNYDYADVTNNLMGLDIDSAFFTVTLNNGKVTNSVAASVYDKIIDSLTVQYNNLPSAGHLVFADVFSRDSVAVSVTIGIIGAFAYGPPINYGNFGEDDWWEYGNGNICMGGYCGESQYEGTHLCDDAALQIERRIRCVISVPAQRKIATDIVTLDIWPNGLVYLKGDPPDTFSQVYYCDFINPEDENPEDNYYDYLSFYNYSGWPNMHDCLEPDEMNFYLHGEESICTDLLFECEDLDQLLDGKVFMSITNEGGILYLYPYYSYNHVMTSTYGVWLVNTNEPITFD